jgi:hypothetical protein
VLALRAFGTVAYARTHGVQPAIDLCFQSLVRGERKPHGLLIRQQPGHFFVEVIDTERRINTQRCRRGLGAQANAVPDLAFQVFRAAEQGGLAARLDHQPASRLFKAGQVIKVAVVTIREVAVAVAR